MATAREDRLSLADALSSFAGQDATVREEIGRAARAVRAADDIACTGAGGCFFIRRADLAALKEFIAFLEGEFELSGILAPERFKADAVVVDMNGERYALTGEPV